MLILGAEKKHWRVIPNWTLIIQNASARMYKDSHFQEVCTEFSSVRRGSRNPYMYFPEQMP